MTNGGGARFWFFFGIRGQGAGKKNKTGVPRGGWVGHSTKKGWGQIFFPIFVYRVLNSLHQKTPKNVIKKNSTKNEYWIYGLWSNCLEKLFDTMFFVKRFFVCF
jgi:hypothetical protein